MPRLLTLDVSLRSTHLEEVLMNAPLLNELSWSRPEGDVGFSGHLTSHTLTTLDINSYEALCTTEFITILQNFPLLSDLTCFVDPDPVHPSHCTPLTFPNLLSLRLGEQSTCRVPPIQVLRSVTLPNLQLLDCGRHLDLYAILPFMSRSACVIRTLLCEICDAHDDDDEDDDNEIDIRRALENFHSVEILHIALESDLIPELLEELDPTSLFILPNLRQLSITSGLHSPPKINYSDIIDVVQGRRAHADTPELELLHLKIEQCNGRKWYPCDALAAELRRLISGGLDFRIRRLDGGPEVLLGAVMT
ncbi:hypothetical protein K438DRAFT_2135494 [Mycena galopus ATCC 62051]|nr:hypothetical protein K438DRAFT_2135494 [Mycena galopus ATCC 62051]